MKHSFEKGTEKLPENKRKEILDIKSVDVNKNFFSNIN